MSELQYLYIAQSMDHDNYYIVGIERDDGLLVLAEAVNKDQADRIAKNLDETIHQLFIRKVMKKHFGSAGLVQ